MRSNRGQNRSLPGAGRFRQRRHIMNVLILNSGSSSLKFQVIATDLERIKEHKDDRLGKGEVERIGGEAIVTFQAGQQPRQKFTAPLRNISAALE